MGLYSFLINIFQSHSSLFMGLYLFPVIVSGLLRFSPLPLYALPMTYGIVPYLNDSSDTNHWFHDVECHALSQVERKIECDSVFVGPYLLSLSIVLGSTFSVRWSVPSFLIDLSQSFSSLFSLFFVCKLIISDKKANVKHYF